MRPLRLIALGVVLVLVVVPWLARRGGDAESRAATPGVSPETQREVAGDALPLGKSRPLVVAAAEARAEVPLAGSGESGRARLVVRVVDAADGMPIEGARVDLGTRADEREIQRVLAAEKSAGPFELYHQKVTTDAAGIAYLARIEELDWELQASHPEYASSELLPFRLAAGLKTGPEPAFELSLSRAALTVTVVDPLGAPAPGTSVLLVELSGARRHRERRTGPEGTAVFDRLRPGLHLVEALGGRRNGFVSAVVQADGPPTSSSRRIELRAGAETQLELVRPPQGILAGCVREGGAPLAGAGVRVHASYRGVGSGGLGVVSLSDYARTQADGCFSGEPLDAGTYVVTVTHSTRCMDEEVEVQVGEGERVLDLDLSLARIEGRVLDARGLPVAGATVVASGDPEARSRALPPGRTRSLRTELDGTYRLHGVRADLEVFVLASHDEHGVASIGPYRLARDEVLRVDLRLAPARGR
jgi:hypothetical protein